jgi:hypothetical protein
LNDFSEKKGYRRKNVDIGVKCLVSCEGERVVESSNRLRSEGWGCLENAFGGFFGVGVLVELWMPF